MELTEMAESIIRLEGKLDNVAECVQRVSDSLEKVSNGAGFPRCVERGERLKAVERWQDRKDKSISWIQRTLYGAGIVLILKILLVDILQIHTIGG